MLLVVYFLSHAQFSTPRTVARARLLWSLDFPGKNNIFGVGCHFNTSEILLTIWVFLFTSHLCILQPAEHLIIIVESNALSTMLCTVTNYKLYQVCLLRWGQSAFDIVKPAYLYTPSLFPFLRRKCFRFQWGPSDEAVYKICWRPLLSSKIDYG